MAIRCLNFATFILTLSSVLVLGISIDLPINCGGNVFDIALKCKQYVEKGGPPTAPSEACCATLKDVDVACYCKFVTPDIVDKISMEKALYVAKTCGVKPIPKDKCGSYTIPPPPFKA
ncbi:putative lipid-transfer protein DIR1 [Vicia villosa]|uniref:putative lipid-transfer protein DIR1 n=1 Tax=Vicia villosa TaxID=3911 RepID=UPI00273B46BD|nr:putative lipid-transfer protein DIR1 [Vicia villosa]